MSPLSEKPGSSASAVGNKPAGPFCGCRTTKIFCLPTCRYTPRVKPQNRVIFTSEIEAREAGYRPCKICRPVP